MNKKKLGLVLLIGIGCLVLVNAAWFFIFDAGLITNVYSLGGAKEVALTFPAMSLNTTSGADSSSSAISFSYNKAGNFTINILETRGDNSNGECVNSTNDCSSTYVLGDGLINWELRNGGVVSIPYSSRPKEIEVNISCVAYSCPQTISTSIKLTEVPTGAT